MCAPSPPPPPDYAAAAVAQGQANKEAALASGMLSNPNIIAPEGTQTVTYGKDPVTGNVIPTVMRAYSPQYQDIFNKSAQLQGLLADLGVSAGGVARGTLAEPISFEGMPAAPVGGEATRQKVIDAAMARVDVDIARQKDAANSQLVAAGIRPGTEAYDRAMQSIDRQRTDALNQAILASGTEAQRDFGTAMEARRQAITEALAQRQIPLNEISAFRTGSQISPLQFQAYQGQNIAPAPTFAATQAQYGAAADIYNQQAAAQNALMGDLFSLGGAAMIGKPWK